MRRGKVGAALCILVGVALTLAVAAMPAGAAQKRVFVEDFGSAAQPTFGAPQGMAVDPFSGDLLVIDTAAQTVSRWHADGTPSEFSALGSNVIDGKAGGADATPGGSILGGGTAASEVQVAVDGSGGVTNGDIYVTNVSAGAIDIFASSGAFLGRLNKYVNASHEEKPLGETCGVGVDASGAVYVGDYTNEMVHKYVPAGNPPANGDSVANFSYPNPCTLAAGRGSSAGLLFVVQFGGGKLSKMNSISGELICQIDEGIIDEKDPDAVTTVSVDPVTGHVFAADGKEAVEYEASGGAGPCATEVSVAKPGSFIAGLAPEKGNGGGIYLARAGKSHVEIYSAPIPPPGVITGAAEPIGETSATLHGTVDPEGGAVSECFFEYVNEAAYNPKAVDPYAAGAVAPCAESPAEIGKGSAPIPVHADLSSLEAGVEYHYRLVAKNASGATPGADRTFATRVPPVIADEWVVGTTSGEATLRARIDPKHYPTSFHVEYGPSESYGQSTAELLVASDGKLHTVTTILTGLQPGQSYHWRIVAKSENGEVEGPDRTFSTYFLSTQTPCANDAFRSGPGATLPDCRAYEMVTPPEKNGGDAVPVPGSGTGYRQASLDGNRLTYTAGTAFGDAVRGAYANQYLASRSEGEGWSSHALNPAQGMTVFDVAGRNLVSSPDLTNFFQLFSPDLCFALLQDDNYEPLIPEAIHGYTDAYLRDNCGPNSGSYDAVTRGGPPSSSGLGVDLWLQVRNLTPDQRYAAFSSKAALTPDAAPANEQYNQLYIYDFATGQLRLVSILPGGTASTRNGALGTGPPTLRQASLARALAEDGSRVFWTASNREANEIEGSIYVRLNPAEEQSTFDGEGRCTESTKACTLAIFEEEGGKRARFWTASVDGNKAIYSVGGDLKEFDIESEKSNVIAGQTGGVVGASDDLSYVYFTSKEAISGSGQNQRSEVAQEGEWNLYLRHGGTVQFIATLALLDHGEATPAKIDSPFPRDHSSRATPDGRHLAFMSFRPLTGYDNTDAVSGEADSEVFVYDADSTSLTCASCNPSGARPVGRDLGPHTGEKVNERWTAAWIPPWEWSNYAKRSLSDDGSRFFFNALDGLVPGDDNQAQDVYEWEAPGAGSCHVGGPDYSAANGGCVSLISSGHGGDSELIDSSATGDDVFFETAASIGGRDTGLIDIYDARVGGGEPQPVAAASPCVGDACQPVPTPPGAKEPTSAGYHGPGNPTAGHPSKPCPKGRHRVKRKGHSRCVAKHRHHRTTKHHRRAGR